jgi:hypothetical protein
MLARRMGSTVRGSVQRFADLLLYCVLLVQTLAGVSITASVGLPLQLKPVYAAIQAFQLTGITIHQRCLGSLPPFLGETLACVGMLAVLGLLAAVVAVQHRMKQIHVKPPRRGARAGIMTSSLVRRACDAVGFFSCLCLTALFSRTCDSVLTMLRCVDVTLPVQQAAALNGANDQLLSSVGSSGLLIVTVLESSQSFMCYRGAHLAPAVVAWLTLLLFVVGFPLGSLAWGWHSLNQGSAPPPPGNASGNSSPQQPAALQDSLSRFLLHGTYRPRAFAARHLDLATFFGLALIAVLWRLPSSASGYAARGAVTCLLLAALGGCLLWIRPFSPGEAWRLPLRVGGLVIACLVAAINSLEGAAQLPEAAPSLGDAVGGMAWLLLVTTLMYAVLLIVVIGRSLISGAQADATLLALQRKAKGAVRAAGKAWGPVSTWTSRRINQSESDASDPRQDPTVRTHGVVMVSAPQHVTRSELQSADPRVRRLLLASMRPGGNASAVAGQDAGSAPIAAVQPWISGGTTVPEFSGGALPSWLRDRGIHTNSERSEIGHVHAPLALRSEVSLRRLLDGPKEDRSDHGFQMRNPLSGSSTADFARVRPNPSTAEMGQSATATPMPDTASKVALQYEFPHQRSAHPASAPVTGRHQK